MAERIDLLQTIFRRKDDGRVFEVVGIIVDPAVIIRDVVSGEQQTHVIGSTNLSEDYVELRPVRHD